jgi:very-short-patch-repair endonuclease
MLSAGLLLAQAEAQHGVVTVGQLAECGFSTKAIARLCRSGWLRRVRRGAYAVGGRPPSPWEQAVAVALLAGPGATLSHYTAAAIHGMPVGLADDAVELTVELPRAPCFEGVRIHRVRGLGSSDVIKVKGIRVTTPARTLVDLAGRLAPDYLARVLDEGRIRRLWTPAELAATADRAGSRGRGRNSSLRELIRRQDDVQIESMLEARIIRALQPFAPFEVQYQLVLDGHVLILDIAWPRPRVAVESDGWGVRSRSRTKFDQDRRKGNLLAAHGWTVVHLTSAMSDDEIGETVGRFVPAHRSGPRAQRGPGVGY